MSTTKLDSPLNDADASGRRQPERPQASLIHLLSDVMADTRHLLTTEITLARRELSNAIDQAKTGVGQLAMGAAVTTVGLGALTGAIILALAMVMDGWLAALLTSAVLLIIGLSLMSSARSKMSAQAFVPDKTLRSLRKDTEAIRRTT